MVNPNTMDALAWLRKHLDDDGNDLLREMVRGFAEQLMAAEVGVLTDAGWGEVSPDRVNQGTVVGIGRSTRGRATIDLAIPKLRQDSYFPDWLLDPRRRAEKALVALWPSATCVACRPVALMAS